jgi:hypothetical protein
MDSDSPIRPRNLIWLPNDAGAWTTLCRGAVLTVGYRGQSQWAWAADVDGNRLSEGVSPSLEHARLAAANAAVEAAGGG